MTEIVKKEYFVYKDKEYDTWLEADKDRLADELSNINQKYQLLVKRSKIVLQKYERMSYPYLLIFREKYGDRHFNIDSLETLLNVSKKIFLERTNPTYPWYYGVNMLLAEIVKEENSRELMFAFLCERCDCEYESILFETYENCNE